MNTLNMNKIVVLGAGNAGLCLFAKLKLMGCDVKIYSDVAHDSKLNYILQNGKYIKLINQVEQSENIIKIDAADICASFAEVVQHANLIYNTIPIQEHESIFTEIYYHSDLQNKPSIFANLGGGFGVFQQILIQKANPLVNIGTFHTLPYACRAIGNEVTLLNIRDNTTFKFSNDNIQTNVICEHLFNADLTLDKSLLHLSLDRSSYHMHPAILMCNVGSVESKNNFYFYRDGLSDSVYNLLVACGQERQELGKTFGYNDFVDPHKRMENFRKKFSKDFSSILGPTSLNHRYIDEDIEYGLVPLYTLAKVQGIDIPLTKSLIDLGCALTGKNFWNSSLNLLKNKELVETFVGYA